MVPRRRGMRAGAARGGRRGAGVGRAEGRDAGSGERRGTGGAHPQVRVPDGFWCEKHDSVWMDGVLVRVHGAWVCEKHDSVWICEGYLTMGDGESMHYRRFGARGAASPAPRSHPSVHFRRFGARKAAPPAPEGACPTLGEANVASTVRIRHCTLFVELFVAKLNEQSAISDTCGGESQAAGSHRWGMQMSSIRLFVRNCFRTYTTEVLQTGLSGQRRPRWLPSWRARSCSGATRWSRPRMSERFDVAARHLEGHDAAAGAEGVGEDG